jgi:hypothetical protein
VLGTWNQMTLWFFLIPKLFGFTRMSHHMFIKSLLMRIPAVLILIRTSEMCIILFVSTKKGLQLAKRKGKKNKGIQKSSRPYVYATSSPDQINRIAIQVFGSSYFTLVKQNN